MKQFSILLLAIFLFSSCENNDVEDPYLLDFPILTFEKSSIDCYPSQQGTAITNNEEYTAFQDENINEYYCENTVYPTIDFTKYTLIGIQRDVACSIKTSYFNAYNDASNKKYIIQAITEGEGNCFMQVLDKHWALIPVLPDGYSVEFVGE